MTSILLKGSFQLEIISTPVTEFNTPELNGLVDDLWCQIPDRGMGLAAPQIGVNKRVFIVRPNLQVDDYPLVFINPEIIEKSKSTSTEFEGCLSIPGQLFQIKRSRSIFIRAQNEKGEYFELRTFSDILSRVIQHEIDHLNGILISND